MRVSRCVCHSVMVCAARQCAHCAQPTAAGQARRPTDRRGDERSHPVRQHDQARACRHRQVRLCLDAHRLPPRIGGERGLVVQDSAVLVHFYERLDQTRSACGTVVQQCNTGRPPVAHLSHTCRTHATARLAEALPLLERCLSARRNRRPVRCTVGTVAMLCYSCAHSQAT